MTQTAAQYLAEVTSTYTPSSSQFDGAKSHKASIQSGSAARIGDI